MGPNPVHHTPGPAGPVDPAVDMEFIRLLFTHPVEEEVAHRWATRLSRLLGPAAAQLRPATPLAELLAWAAAAGVDSIDFTLVFEPELRMEFAEFLETSEVSTFRDMVEHYAGRYIH